MTLRNIGGRRAAVAAGAVVLAVAGATAVTATGGTDVTRPRLERSLPQTFANLYVQQARILGHPGVTAASLHARAQCDKGGPHVADRGPGADWICLMSWDDPNLPLPDGYGKFELNVHSNDCYTAGGPSKLVGQLTITDRSGRDVANPVFEFDGCFDPNGDDSPTGVVFAADPTKPASSAPSPPAATLAAGPVRSGRGTVLVRMDCATGSGGCAGTVEVAAGAARARGTYVAAEGAGTTVRRPAHRHRRLGDGEGPPGDRNRSRGRHAEAGGVPLANTVRGFPACPSGPRRARSRPAGSTLGDGRTDGGPR